MRKTLVVCLLVLLLTGPALAGEMQNGAPAPPPPSQPASAVQEPTTGGEILDDVPESLTLIALELLAVLPSLL